MSTCRVVAVALLCWSIGECAAQAPARRPVFGRVAASSGEPIPGATVTLVGFPSHLDPQREAPDVVVAVADARGQYRAAVIAGLPYFGCACGPEADGGAVARSELRGWFGAGAIVDFQCAAPDGPFDVTVGGLEAWADDAPLTFHVRPEPYGHAVHLPFAVPVAADADGRVAWPALPRGVLELRAAGEVLWHERIRPQADAVSAVPAPQVVPCTVVDELGAPIAGAEIRVRVGAFSDRPVDGIETLRGHRTRLLARTDADGNAALRLPFEGDLFAKSTHETVMFTARAPGRVERVSSLGGRNRYRDDQLAPHEENKTLCFALARAKPVEGTVRHGARAARQGATVRAHVTGKLETKGGYLHDARMYDGTVDADGRFAIDCVPDDPHAIRLALLTQGGVVPFEVAVRRGEAAMLDLAAVATLRLLVLDTRHGPGAGLVVYLRQLSGRGGAGATTRCCVDGAGRGEWQLAAGTWFVFTADDTGVAFANVTLDAGRASAVELALEPYPLLRGTLADDLGRPCADARLHVRGQGGSGGLKDDAKIARSLLADRLGRLLRAVRTGPDGSFAIPCAPFPGYVVTAQFVGEGQRTDAFPLDPAKSPVQLRWQ
jgi:hypothetical protein